MAARIAGLPAGVARNCCVSVLVASGCGSCKALAARSLQ
jgi:hypothetical protein